MKIIIHRGANQIGGCITEIATAGSRILIDLGHNLPKPNSVDCDKFANADAIAKLCKSCDAVFYTHYHGDHFDLFRYVPDHTTQYIGEVAKSILITKFKYLSKAPELHDDSNEAILKLEHFNCYEKNKEINIGDIKLIPYFVSHSAVDAYMFLIEAEGKRILHTGDFRDHGFLGKGLNKIVDYLVGEVDVLITEGTMLGRRDENVPHEYDIFKQLKSIMLNHKNVFILCSSTDPDRLASVHKANKYLSNRPLICDAFQKEILNTLSKTQGKINNLYSFEHKVYDFRTNNLKLINWMHKEGFTMLVRSGDKFRDWCNDFLKDCHPDETILVYSIYKGYIIPEHEAYNQKLHDFVKLFPQYLYCHTSGHATTECLSNVCILTNPQLAIIPIHKIKETDFATINLSDTLKSRIIRSSTVLENIEIEIKS